MAEQIAVIGSSNIDLTMKVSSLPIAGESVNGGEFKQNFGGKGANQAIAAARSGADTKFITAIGNDTYSDSLMTNYQKEGLSSENFVEIKDEGNGYALIMIDDKGMYYLSVAPGANHRLQKQHIDEKLEALKDCQLWIIQCELSESCTVYILEKAKSLGIPIMWNVAPAAEYALKHLGYLKYLVVNESEAQTLCGVAIEDEKSLVLAGKRLKDKGVDTVIITLGAQGVYCLNDNEEHRLKAFKVQSTDTTAAGDTFCGAFASAIISGNSIPHSLRFASAASALAVQTLGAQSSIPTKEAILQFLKSRQGE